MPRNGIPASTELRVRPAGWEGNPESKRFPLSLLGHAMPKIYVPIVEVFTLPEDMDADASAWGLDDDAEAEDAEAKSENGTKDDPEEEDADAWGWGDDDATAEAEEPDNKSPAKSSAKEPVQKHGRKPSKGQPSERELTLRETYSVTAIPDAIMEMVVQIVSDAQALGQPK